MNKTKLDYELSKELSRNGYSKDNYNHEHNEDEWSVFGVGMDKMFFPFPTISDVLDWIYTKYDIYISLIRNQQGEFMVWICLPDKEPYSKGILINGSVEIVTTEYFLTRKEAYISAIKYFLLVLIKEHKKV